MSTVSSGWMVLLLATAAVGVADDPVVDFEREVAPVLLQRCMECHQEKDPSGSLVLSRRDTILRGGDSGPAVLPGDALNSLLFQRVASGEMPPEQNGHSQALPRDEVHVLRRWIQQGMQFPEGRTLDLFETTLPGRAGRDWWSLQPLRNVRIPQHFSDRNPIDFLVRQRLKNAGLEPAPRAEWSVLMRRLANVLTGLPPQAQLVADCLSRVAPSDADHATVFAAVVDRLLATDQYGERWARHWLDVVRYADTSGYERDQEKPYSWKYRDWVIDAFNSDLPWSDFVIRQLAGDQISDRTESSVTATGFLRLGTWNDEPNDPQDYTYERLEDLVHTTSTAFLGLTVKCARCHDHKFDPIPHADYYRFAAAFWAGPVRPRGRDLLGGPSAEELGFTELLGWTDIDPTPPEFRVLRSGDRNQPLQLVFPGPLSCIESHPGDPAGPLQGYSSAPRLRLAKWIADSANPLTARVAVNRIWQHHFGEGLVRSPDNFGFNGEQPSHPLLLDWLAGEFLKSGGSIKHIHRLILTSETWQQSSVHPQTYACDLVDPGNRLLWKMERRRVDAETLRDSLLAVTRELDLRMGGRGFLPDVPPEALEGLSRKASAWQASSPAEQLRRSVYMYSQRSLLPPMMTAFDFGDTTLPCGRRDSTIVAPQALTLLNNGFVHQRAEALARLIPTETELSSEAVAAEVWNRVLNRRPSPQESRLAAAHLNSQTQRFSTLPAMSNETPGEASADLIEFCRAYAAAGTSVEQPSVQTLADCVLFLQANVGVQLDDNGAVEVWHDQSVVANHAIQQLSQNRPRFLSADNDQQESLTFHADARQFLHLSKSLLTDQEFTILAVTTDSGKPGHRELLSNWNGGAGNSVTSLFLGLTGERQVRLSDAVSGVGEIRDLRSPFLFSASNGPQGAMIYQGDRLVHQMPGPLPERRLDTAWVIGQQGNFDAEYWSGTLQLLMVFDRQLSEAERRLLRSAITTRFRLRVSRPPELVHKPPTARQRAVASLALVLMNSNEFLFID